MFALQRRIAEFCKVKLPYHTASHKSLNLNSAPSPHPFISMKQGGKTALVTDNLEIPKIPAPQPTANTISCKLEFRGFMSDHLDFFSYFARYSAHALGLPCGETIHLPTKIKKWTINKGPFVHAKTKENFEQRTYRRMIEVHDANPKSLEDWIRYVETNLPDGVDLHITRFEWIQNMNQLEQAFAKAKEVVSGFESRDVGKDVPFHIAVEQKAAEFLKRFSENKLQM
ncbi:mitochondrial 37S ribosomal protein rsm10 [Nowakowskiella sp. JEL0078]|nr:mitochondrial 37S ribosomal protein rsm10 [Nowakowskiella sp. JEL0078]